MSPAQRPLFVLCEVHPESEEEEHEEYMAAVFASEAEAVLYQDEMCDYALCNGNVCTVALSDHRAAVIFQTREGEQRADHALLTDLARFRKLQLPLLANTGQSATDGLLGGLHMLGPLETLPEDERPKAALYINMLTSLLDGHLKLMSGQLNRGQSLN